MQNVWTFVRVAYLHCCQDNISVVLLRRPLLNGAENGPLGSLGGSLFSGLNDSLIFCVLLDVHDVKEFNTLDKSHEVSLLICISFHNHSKDMRGAESEGIFVKSFSSELKSFENVRLNWNRLSQDLILQLNSGVQPKDIPPIIFGWTFCNVALADKNKQFYRASPRKSDVERDTVFCSYLSLSLSLSLSLCPFIRQY